MNLAEKMALDCGVKISKPHVDRLFMPTRNNNFIIFDTRSKHSVGQYDYFADVFDLVKGYLKANNIDVFQIATEKSQRLACDKCYITLNKKQEAYLISKAKLVISSENYSLYLASVFNTKSIGLYSAYRPQNAQPVWNKESQIILESNRNGNLPSYAELNESPKCINFISPYIIAENILNSLGIDNELHNFELVNLGSSYAQKIIEVVPDFMSNEAFLKDKSINLRLDYIQSLNAAVFNYWLTNRKVNIITDKDINVNLIAPYRSNIIMLTVMMSDNISEKFLKQCKSIGLKVKIFCNSKEKLESYRFKFLNWDIEKDFDEKRKLCELDNISDKSFFISSKVLISKGKQFSCKANFVRNKPLDKNPEHVIFSEEFEEELDFFKIYNEREESTSSASVA